MSYQIRVALDDAINMTIHDTVVCLNMEDTEVIWNSLLDGEPYGVQYFLIANLHQPKILYIITYNEGVNDVRIRIFILNIHIFQLVVLEKVLKETIAILLVFIL